MSDVLQLPDFPAASREAWLERVERVLKGRPFASLRSQTSDGIIVDPLYAPVRGAVIAARSSGSPWTIVQRMDHPEAALANDIALEDTANGASGLSLAFTGAAAARGFGLRDSHARAIAAALREVPVHALHLRLEAGPRGADAAEALREVVAARSFSPERASISFGMDPIGALAASGKLDTDLREACGRMAALAASLAGEYAGPFFEADGRIYHDGGGSEGQELGAALATAVSYLRALDGKLDDAQLARAVGITLAVDADLFTSMAKFRAARLLWKELLGACQLPVTPLRLHGETSWRMMTRQDAHGNLLRNVAAVFAAGVGGADSICALPFSLAAGLPDGFARRMARNAQIILIEEAGVHLVGDAAAGSGIVHHICRSMAEKAWAFFQAIESKGGMAEALEGGFVQSEIRRMQELRRHEIAGGERTIVGVTKFAAEQESAPAILPLAASPLPGQKVAMGITPGRDSEEFELQGARS